MNIASECQVGAPVKHWAPVALTHTLMALGVGQRGGERPHRLLTPPSVRNDWFGRNVVLCTLSIL